MKNKSLSLHIDEPCHEKWTEMTPTEQGRFCSSCQKTVTDFTGLTDNEILAVMRSNSNVCGRFYADQLNRKIVETQLKGNNWKLNSAFTALFVAVGAAASAQNPDTTYHPTVVVDEKHPTGPVCIGTQTTEAKPDAHMYTLDVIIMDTIRGGPVINAYVGVVSTSFSAITDSTGHVKLSFPDSVATESVKFHVATSYEAYADFILTAEQINRTKEVRVGLRTVIFMGDVRSEFDE